jgi:hypothetical protein
VKPRVHISEGTCLNCEGWIIRKKIWQHQNHTGIIE